MAKLNLNALKTNTDNNSSDLEVTPEEKKVEIEEQTISKKKFSLKELNISWTKKENNTNENISSENVKVTEVVSVETEVKNETPLKIEEEPKKAKIWLKSIIKTETSNENKSEAVIKTEETPKEIIKEEVIIQQEIPKDESLVKTNELPKETTNEPEIKKDDSEEVKVLSISDWDTSCSIITEKKSEIFWNYKWSFTQTIQEEEKKPETEVIQDIKIEEPKKTNLESYSNWNIENKKNKSKKIILTSLFTITSLSLSWFFIIESWLLKSNVQETKKEEVNIEVKKEEPKKEEVTENSNNIIEDTQEAPTINEPSTIEETPIVNETPNTEETPVVEENTESVTDNNIKVEETEIVKENLENSVDNNTNYNRIDKKVENFLLKKYKNK